MAKKYLITYRRHNGSIDFWGNGADIYYLFFVVHELGRLIYELEYQKPLSDDVLITSVSYTHLTLPTNVNV